MYACVSRTTEMSSFVIQRPTVTFNDVKGQHEAKVELQDLVAFFKDPQTFKKLGGKVSRGNLLLLLLLLLLFIIIYYLFIIYYCYCCYNNNNNNYYYYYYYLLLLLLLLVRIIVCVCVCVL